MKEGEGGRKYGTMNKKTASQRGRGGNIRK